MTNAIDNVTKTVNTIVNNEESLKEYGLGVGTGAGIILFIWKGLPKVKTTGTKVWNKFFGKKNKVEEVVEEAKEVVEEVVMEVVE